jgi:hypothetical protein
MSRTFTETAHVNACSGKPAFVAVPVVLHGFVRPRPAGTWRLISPGFDALPPLWPGSRTTTPDTGGGAGFFGFLGFAEEGGAVEDGAADEDGAGEEMVVGDGSGAA